MEHVGAAELEAGLPTIEAAPRDEGRVELIVLRPANGERAVVDEAAIDVVRGVVGDNWSTRPNRRTADGRPDPRGQVTLMSARVAALLAGVDRWPGTGDQLFVDLDLSEQNLPPGARLRVGTAVIEVTDKPHLGCAKFRRRFGEDALRFVNSPAGRSLRMRGMNARVVESGVVRVGDRIARHPTSGAS